MRRERSWNRSPERGLRGPRESGPAGPRSSFTRLAFVGVSPDGLVGKPGLVEIKCPASQAKRLAALPQRAHAAEYRWQVQGQLWVAEREWCDVVSYDPRYPEGLQIAITRVFRDESAIKALEQACIAAEPRYAPSSTNFPK